MTVRVVQLNLLTREHHHRTTAGTLSVLSLITLLTGLLVVSGCAGKLKWPGTTTGEPNEPGLQPVPETPAGLRKAELLEQINRKFENPDAHYELGRLYQAERLWPQAEYHYNVALGFDPVHWDAQAAMVNVMLDSGNTAKAKVCADNYMKEVASSAPRSALLALAFQKQKMDEYALACYKQALRLAPDSASVNRQIGYYYLSVGDEPNAKEYLGRSFRLNPYQPDVAQALGKLGVEIRVPGKGLEEAEKLDRIVEQSGKDLQKTP